MKLNSTGKTVKTEEEKAQRGRQEIPGRVKELASIETGRRAEK